MKLLSKKIIMGCDSRGDGDSPYLTRFTIIQTRFGAVYIHLFHRSDADEHHDHPWGFASLILWRGYIEETPSKWRITRSGSVAEMESLMASGEGWEWGGYGIADSAMVSRSDGTNAKRVWPGMLLFRKATHRHRVVLVDNKPAVTLIVRGSVVRDWGFFTCKGWQPWKEYFEERGC